LAVMLSVVLAIFSHENGIVAGGVVLIYWLVVSPRTFTPHAASRLFAPVAVITLVFVVIWLQLPKDRGALQFSLGDIAQNALYFSQGLSYPVAWLVNRLGLGDHAGALLALVITGGVFALALRVAVSQRRGMLFGLLWYAAAAAVPVVFLPHAYAIDGPRLMLLASGGAALVWASLADGLIHGRAWIMRIVAVAAVALTVILGGAFILQRMALHDQLAAIYEMIWDAGDRDAVFINLPAWQAYQRREFPMGSEGITYLTDYIGFPDLVLVNTGSWGDSLAVERADLRPEFPGYYFGSASPAPSVDEIAAAIDQRGLGYLFTNVADRAVWFSAQRVDTLPGGDGFTWANGVHAQDEMPPSDDLALFPVVITWQTDDPAALADDLTAFVHLECGGVLVSQSDGAPLRGALPFRAWRASETWREQRYLPAVDDVAECQLVLGLYSGVTGERVALVGGGDAVALPVGGG
ncbi:MAG: hypothetical protein LC121_02290, partial [Anaerolineae bacterium]|nr:hypothetical protein [Anaerolineae bacterium]